MEQSTASYAMKENDFLSSSKFLRCKFRTDSELEGKDGMAWRLWGSSPQEVLVHTPGQRIIANPPDSSQDILVFHLKMFMNIACHVAPELSFQF